ncbi:anti-sigma factor [Rossellomorea aquimaris]|uniref:anti-sigma factor n=1 Tax=Rossellomorea aquimaris TaxID=189382 RepID=UPI001CD49340|nr:anti-sigma factor [Rossellomorea aquimaris]MCA1055969.1 anti-sigma factor [Rossellomorea aquimaris]
MNQQPCEHILDYFNHHLNDDEKTAFEKHLTTCPECREALTELMELSEYLPYAAEPITPPAGMEDRVFSRIEQSGNSVSPLGKEKRGRRWLFPSVAAALAISLLGNAYLFTQVQQEEEIVEQATIDQVTQFVELAAVNGNATGTASIIKQGEQSSLVVQASRLQDLSQEEVYQVWLIKDEKPERAGTFVPSPDGKGSVVFKLNDEFTKQDWDTVAITLEPDASSQLPQGDIILASEI